jgi:hypothetical protein
MWLQCIALFHLVRYIYLGLVLVYWEKSTWTTSSNWFHTSSRYNSRIYLTVAEQNRLQWRTADRIAKQSEKRQSGISISKDSTADVHHPLLNYFRIVIEFGHKCKFTQGFEIWSLSNIFRHAVRDLPPTNSFQANPIHTFAVQTIRAGLPLGLYEEQFGEMDVTVQRGFEHDHSLISEVNSTSRNSEKVFTS